MDTKKINISTFCGSLNQESSTKKIIYKILKKFNGIEFDHFDLNQNRILLCEGKKDCFFRGYCTLDKVDNFDIIKKKLYESDLIIFGSPVYGDMINAFSKQFIDRISYFQHLMTLKTKYCILVVSTHSNSNRTLKYLYKTFSYFGCIIIGVIIFDHSSDDIKIQQIIDSIYIRFIYLNKYKVKTTSNNILEYIFYNYKKLYDTIDIQGYESTEWNKNFRNFKNFQEILDNYQLCGDKNDSDSYL